MFTPTKHNYKHAVIEAFKKLYGPELKPSQIEISTYELKQADPDKWEAVAHIGQKVYRFIGYLAFPGNPATDGTIDISRSLLLDGEKYNTAV